MPEWLQGGRATIIGPQPRTCAWWESKQLLRDSGEPSKEELEEIEAYLNENSLSDWREVLDHKKSSDLYTGSVSYLKGHGVGEAEAKQRAREYMAESIAVMEYGLDWPEGIESPSLTDFTNARRYLEPVEGPIDGDWPVVEYVLSCLVRD